MTVKRVFIVRHGETDYNVTGRWQGHLQIALNDAGKHQAKLLARYLQPYPVNVIYTSDLIRAYETAEIIAEGRKVDIVKDTRLREINLGAFQGLTREDIQKTYPLEYERWHHDDSYIVPQGESRLQLQARVVTAWQDIIARARVPEVLIVTHGGAIRWLTRHLFDPEQTAGKGIENTSLTTLEREGHHWRLVEFAATPHLAR